VESEGEKKERKERKERKEEDILGGHRVPERAQGSVDGIAEDAIRSWMIRRNEGR
jgi:hypothetical protein